MSFIYELSELFMFPSTKTGYLRCVFIVFVYMSHLLTDTESMSLQFVFFSKSESKVPEEIFRAIIFLVIINSNVLERFDASDEFWEQFGVRKKNTRKQLGLNEIEHIEDPCFVTIATTPK